MQALNTSYKNISKVAIPVILGGFVQTMVLVADNYFLKKESEIFFNAAGTGGLLYLVLYMLAFGYASTAQILVARRAGERNYLCIGPLYWQMVWFMLGFATLMYCCLWFFGNSAVNYLIKNDALATATGSFLHYRAWGIFFAFLNLTFVAFYVGIAKTGILIAVTIFTALLNVFLDYGLIFGYMGFPKMGLEGAAIASSLSEATAFLFGAIYTIFFVDRKKFGLHAMVSVRWSLFVRLTKLSFPLMLQSFISLAAWLVFFFIVEKIGHVEYTISNTIRNIYSIILIPLFGFNATAKTYVSGLIAEQRMHEVKPMIKRIAILTGGSTLILLCCNLLFPEAVLGIWLDQNDAALMAQAIPVLYVVTGSLLLFAVASVAFQVVSGCGDTRTALLIEFLAITIYLIFAWYITIYLKSDLHIVWASEYIYFSLLLVASLLYIRSDRWKKVKV